MISTNDQRIYLVPAVGSITDLTLPLSEFDSTTATVAMNADVDYLYIGSSLPFNHRWFEITSANVTSAVVSVDIWYTNQWKPVVDILDRTASSGTPMAASGNLEFTPNREFGWDIEQDSDDIDELASAPLTYNKYWMRISFDANVSFDLKYVGQKFSNSTELYKKYPVFDSTTLRRSWDAAKTDWEEQMIEASDEVIEDLISRRIIWDRNQVLDLATMRNPTIHRCASLIFRGLGANRNLEQLKDSDAKYHSSMNKKKWNVDLNRDGELDSTERKSSTIFMTR